MFASRKAEKIIVKQINELTFDRVPFKKTEISNAIKWFYWQGTFSEKKYCRLNSLLSNKYALLYNEWLQKLCDDCDRNYRANMKRYGVDV